MSLFDIAIEETNAAAEGRVLLTIPASPNVELLFRTVTAQDISQAQKGARRAHPKDDVLQDFQTSVALIANCNLEIWVKGETLLTEAGDPATFRDVETHQHWKVATASDAVRRLIRRDGDLTMISRALLAESGFNADGSPLEAENPTQD